MSVPRRDGADMAVREQAQAPDSETSVPGSLLRVVGVGASAGGLEALQELLGAITPGTGAAMVIAQHLAPDYSTLLVDLLADASALPVTTAVDGAILQADTVVVAPPKHDIKVVGDRVSLLEPSVRYSPSPSIDLLFESLAESWGDQAVGIVLSGTGSDGAHGLRLVRSAGGLTLVQEPTSARFDGMPRAALAFGGAELVGAPSELAARLTELIPRLEAATIAPAKVPDLPMLAAITAQLRRHVGIDFSRYKESTVRRQIQRRMAVRQVSDVEDYFALLSEDRDEAQALSQNLLVTVTSFFRDPDAFAALRERLVDYVSRSAAGEPLRVWVPGCATGEEAYSIAMILSDALGNPEGLSERLKIFGTDLDETSLGIARRGEYPLSAMASMPPELQARFVNVTASGIQVLQSLRECMVFARHDVGEDPPFARLDLISCRNTLIYFNPRLQERVLNLFTYALREGGLLFLGRTESLDQSTAGYVTVDADHRIFARNDEVLSRPEVLDRGPVSRGRRPGALAPEVVAGKEPAADVHAELLEALVRSAVPPCVVLDEQHNLVEVVGDVSAFCRVPEGKVTRAVGSFLRAELQDEARALFLLCRADNAEVSGQRIHVDDPAMSVRLRVSPIQVGDRSLSVLAFLRDEQPVADQGSDRTAVFDREISRLERELLSSQEVTLKSLTELQAANEELEAASEELQAAMEELQATNEELEASNEELQATNEELGILNGELQAKGSRVQQLNRDLENVQASMNQGLIIVDADMRVVRYSPLAVRVFALMETDVGKALSTVPTTLDVSDLHDALEEVVTGGARRSIECGDDSVSYLIQVLPYTDADDRRLGAILTLTDITELVTLRRAAGEAYEQLEVKAALLKEQATYDTLTGLLNRGRFNESLALEIARVQRSDANLALVMLDLDRFKVINDERGHEAGDAVLRAAAERLMDSVRGTDIVGRLGGDEFGVIISNYEAEYELDVILERIVEALAQPVTFQDWSLTVSGSLGVAFYPEDDATPDGLLRAADAAMYATKKGGGGSFTYFDPSMNEAADQRRGLRSRLDAAMADGEFTLHYQPIVGSVDHRTWGVEAVLRWNRDGEVIPAAAFVPFCEESGQIRPLGLLTLGLLRADIGRLRAAGHDGVAVSINMSVSQLEDPHLADLFEAWPMPQGLSGIVIEVTESVFMPEHVRALGLLATLQGLGARILVAGYGSAASNPRKLLALAPALIKLNGSLIDELPHRAAREALIRSAVDMSRVWGAEVIAQGITDPESEGIALAAGVDYVQGFGIAPPMPMDDLLTWLVPQPS